MDSTKFDVIVNAVTNAGYFSMPIDEMAGGWKRLVVASQKGPDGFGGNSFWITCVRRNWVIATWAGHYYLSPNKTKTKQFILKAFEAYSANTFYEIPSHLKEAVGLQEISIEDFNLLLNG